MQSKVRVFLVNPFWAGFILSSLIVLITLSIVWYKVAGIGDQEYNQLEITDLSGKRADFSQFSRHPLVVNYWATWCKPCIEEFPGFQNANAIHKGNVIFIMISDDSIEKATRIIGDNKYKFNFYIARKKLRLDARPVTLFYNENHELIDKHIGAMSEETLLREINLSLK